MQKLGKFYQKSTNKKYKKYMQSPNQSHISVWSGIIKNLCIPTSLLLGSVAADIGNLAKVNLAFAMESGELAKKVSHVTR